MSDIRHKVFISYHHDDQTAAEKFVETFDEERDVFITRALGVDIEQDINSDDTDYVMQRIRQLYLIDSTVTIVLMGRCTWARRYVDWEIQSSLRHGETVTANGLLGIKLPSFRKDDYYPQRLNANLKQDDQQADCYARVIGYPARKDTLASYIDDVFNARTSRADLIVNSRDRFKINKHCP